LVKVSIHSNSESLQLIGEEFIVIGVAKEIAGDSDDDDDVVVVVAPANAVVCAAVGCSVAVAAAAVTVEASWNGCKGSIK